MLSIVTILILEDKIKQWAHTLAIVVIEAVFQAAMSPLNAVAPLNACRAEPRALKELTYYGVCEVCSRNE